MRCKYFLLGIFKDTLFHLQFIEQKIYKRLPYWILGMTVITQCEWRLYEGDGRQGILWYTLFYFYKLQHKWRKNLYTPPPPPVIYEVRVNTACVAQTTSCLQQ